MTWSSWTRAGARGLRAASTASARTTSSRVASAAARVHSLIWRRRGHRARARAGHAPIAARHLRHRGGALRSEGEGSRRRWIGRWTRSWHWSCRTLTCEASAMSRDYDMNLTPQTPRTPAATSVSSSSTSRSSATSSAGRADRGAPQRARIVRLPRQRRPDLRRPRGAGPALARLRGRHLLQLLLDEAARGAHLRRVHGHRLLREGRGPDPPGARAEARDQGRRDHRGRQGLAGHRALPRRLPSGLRPAVVFDGEVAGKIGTAATLERVAPWSEGSSRPEEAQP